MWLVCLLEAVVIAIIIVAVVITIGLNNNNGNNLSDHNNRCNRNIHNNNRVKNLNNNINTTIHAGEAYGPRSIHQALHVCGAHRIGHGTRVYEDIDLLNYINR